MVWIIHRGVWGRVAAVVEGVRGDEDGAARRDEHAVVPVVLPGTVGDACRNSGWVCDKYEIKATWDKTLTWV